MKKVKLAVMALFGIALIIACSNDQNVTPTGQEISALNKLDLLLEKKYDFKSMIHGLNKSDVLEFSSTTLNKSSEEIFVSEADLDLKNITLITWKDENISYLIPFLGNPVKNLVISIRKGDDINNLDLQKGTIVDNQVDKTGNGTLLVTDIEGSIEYVFEKGIKIQENQTPAPTPTTPIKKKTFRECFDQAYNDICDGFIGCASWYSSPLPALTAVAYCGATT